MEEGEKIEGGAMKHLLSGAIGAMMMFLVMWFTMGDQSDCRSIQASHEQQLKEVQWEAKLVQHRLAKAQRELGEQLAQRIGKIDDVMPVKVQVVSKIDEEVSSITALAKRLAPVEKAVKKVAEVEGGFVDVPWIKQQIVRVAPAVPLFLMRGK